MQNNRKDFYIFRHGETDLNKAGRWQGSGMDYDLNETGIFQGERLARKLKDTNLQVIFYSPLKRAKHTADIVGGILDIPVIVKQDLRECFYGDAEGKLVADLRRDVPEIINNWYDPKYWDISFSNGESKQDALMRVLKVLEKLTVENYAFIGIAIHGGTMGALLNHFGFVFENIANCAVFHLIYEDEKWQIEGDLF